MLLFSVSSYLPTKGCYRKLLSRKSGINRTICFKSAFVMKGILAILTLVQTLMIKCPPSCIKVTDIIIPILCFGIFINFKKKTGIIEWNNEI